MRSYVASQNLKESDSDGHPDSESQTLNKLKTKGAEALDVKIWYFWRSSTMVLKMLEG